MDGFVTGVYRAIWGLHFFMMPNDDILIEYHMKKKIIDYGLCQNINSLDYETSNTPRMVYLK